MLFGQFAFVVITTVHLAIALDIPIGIHLGLFNLTSAYISTDGNPRTLASVPGSLDYQEYMKSLALKDQNHQQTSTTDTSREILFNAIETIRLATSKLLKPSATPKITGITVPDFHQPREDVCNAAGKALPDSYLDYFQILGLTRAMRLAYELNSCENIRLDSKSCDLDNGHYMLFLDLNPHHLQISFAEVGVHTLLIQNRTLSLALGADSKAEGGQQWAEFATKMMKDFISDNLASKSISYKLQGLSSIVIAGEADQLYMKRLRTILEDLLPDHQNLIHDDIAYEWVGAIGAAYLSKLQANQNLHTADGPNWKASGNTLDQLGKEVGHAFVVVGDVIGKGVKDTGLQISDAFKDLEKAITGKNRDGH
ncbi:hypothetical protein BT63DRAFT_474470 [Microthyrium microscopicum]|uniref:Actin-like ATPase domain-containing protein n=1 Tax=Microthyrium microscopicum TaxID=703497 RepID=A0A6A6UUL3_9PEZI|nr:hypothetical protein BT63DRAFT_474470 [Microthyrium microscopicum]